MKKIEKIKKLHALTDMRFLALQTKMAELSGQEQDLRNTLAELSKSVSERQANPKDDAAMIAGADIRWHRWVDQRKTALNIELAKLTAQKESYQQVLKEAFGQYQVTKKLVAQFSSDDATALKK